MPLEFQNKTNIEIIGFDASRIRLRLVRFVRYRFVRYRFRFVRYRYLMQTFCLSPRRPQNVFSVAIFCLQDVFKTTWKAKICYAKDLLKASLRHVLNRRLQDVIKTNKCLLGSLSWGNATPFFFLNVIIPIFRCYHAGLLYHKRS